MCYCKKDRVLGSLEYHCSICLQWFHFHCLKGNVGHYNSPAFMVDYRFSCKNCHPQSELLKPKRANFVYAVITAFATKHLELQEETGDDSGYLDLAGDIIPYMESKWDLLTPLRTKTRARLQSELFSTVRKYDRIFSQKFGHEEQFALIEKDLLLIGPLHPAIVDIGRRKKPQQSIRT